MSGKRTSDRAVQTTNGPFHTKKKAIIPLKKGKTLITSEALIHKNLPANLLSAKPIIDKVIAILLDQSGAALLPTEKYDNINPKLKKTSHSTRTIYTM